MQDYWWVIKFLFILLFILFPLGQLERIPLANPQIGLYAHDLVIVVILVYWFGKKILLHERLIVGEVGRVGKGILAFFTVAFISFLLNSFKRIPGEIFIAGLYFARWSSYAAIYFIIKEEKVKCSRHPEAKPCLTWRSRMIPRRFFAIALNDVKAQSPTQLLIAAGFASAVFGLIQYIFYPDIRPLTVYYWDPHYYRVVGTFLEPGFVGLIYVLAMILIVCQLHNVIPAKAGIYINGIFNYLYSFRIKCGMTEVVNFINSLSKFTIYYLLFTICYLAFALTYSRSAYLSFLLAMGIISYFKKSKRFFMTVLITFILTILVLPRPGGEGVKLERKTSVKSRLINWGQALIIAKEHPIFGIGFNFYRYEARDQGFLTQKDWPQTHAGAGADNSFLFVLATTGIIGLLAFLYLIFNIVKKSPLVVLTSLGAILAHSLFNNSFFYPWVMIWFWVLLGAYGV